MPSYYACGNKVDQRNKTIMGVNVHSHQNERANESLDRGAFERVAPKLLPVFEVLKAFLTDIGYLPVIVSQMVTEVPFQNKLFVTVRAWKRLQGFGCVACVFWWLHAPWISKCFRAFVALKRLYFQMSPVAVRCKL